MWVCPVCGATKFAFVPNGGKNHRIRCALCEHTFVLEEPLISGYSRDW